MIPMVAYPAAVSYAIVNRGEEIAVTARDQEIGKSKNLTTDQH
jgi:hypothetical protein